MPHCDVDTLSRFFFFTVFPRVSLTPSCKGLLQQGKPNIPFSVLSASGAVLCDIHPHGQLITRGL